IAAAEAIVRYLNGQPLFLFPLTEAIDPGVIKPEEVAKVPLARGVDPKWFYSDPPPLPNRSKPPPGWQERFHYLEAHPSGHAEFRTMDNFKAYNIAYVGDPCTHRYLRHAPGSLFVYDPADGKSLPPYRFY